MKSGLSNSQVAEVLERLYTDASANDPLVHQAAKESGIAYKTEAEFFRAVRQAYMPIGRAFGTLLYAMGRSSNAKTIVEFGTSFGISTIYLAAAVRDNGKGKVITTEFEPEKAGRAKQNLIEAGLADWVDFRVGDALQTLKADLPGEIDLLFLDGAKSLYIEVLKLLEPSLRPGAIIASDNTNHDGMGPFLEYIRNAGSSYASSAIVTTDRARPSGHEVTVRL